jgi:hypothetical protein
MKNPINGTDGKLGRGFMSVDKLEEIDMVTSQGRRLSILIWIQLSERS